MSQYSWTPAFAGVTEIRGGDGYRAIHRHFRDFDGTAAHGVSVIALVLWALFASSGTWADVPRIPAARLREKPVAVSYVTGPGPLYVLQADGIGLSSGQSLELTVSTSEPTQLRFYLIPEAGVSRFRYLVLTRERPSVTLRLPLEAFDPEPSLARGEVPAGGALVVLDVPGFMRRTLANTLTLGPCRVIDDEAPVPEAERTPPGPPVPDPRLDAILGGWVGKVAGGRLGMPLEGALEPAWDRLEDLSKGLPAESWGFGPDDDTSLMVLNLLTLRHRGRELRPEDLLRAWRDRFAREYLWKTERRSLERYEAGTPPLECGQGPQGESLCARIRGDLWGMVSPGDPAAAMDFASRDAPLSNRGTGIDSGRFAAVSASLAFVTTTPGELLDRVCEALAPAAREHAAMIGFIRRSHAGGMEVRELREAVRRRWFEPALRRDPENAWAYALPNDALVATALLYGGGDFARTLALAAALGWDTDCNAATAGLLLGIQLGASRLPAAFTEPLHDRLRTAVPGHEHLSLRWLARETRKAVPDD